MVHSEVAGRNTLDFSDITIVLLPLAKAGREESAEGGSQGLRVDKNVDLCPPEAFRTIFQFSSYAIQKKNVSQGGTKVHYCSFLEGKTTLYVSGRFCFMFWSFF